MKLPLTKVFAKAGLENVTSAMCKHQQWFGLDVQFSALACLPAGRQVHNFNIIFSNEHLYRAGQSMNSLPSQILECWLQVLRHTLTIIALTNFSGFDTHF